MLVSGTYGVGSRKGDRKLQIGDKILPSGSRLGNTFIAKLDAKANGKVIWAHGFTSHDKAYSIESDSIFDEEGNAYLSGRFSHFMILPKVGTRPKFLMSQGRGGQGFVHKIDTDGNLEWSQLLSSKVGTFIDSISMSSDGLLNLVCRAEKSNRENNSVKIGGHSYNSEREGSVYLTTLDKNGLFVSSNHIAKNSRVILRDLLPTDDGIIGVGETEVEFTLGERLISPGEFAGFFRLMERSVLLEVRRVGMCNLAMGILLASEVMLKNFLLMVRFGL